MLIDTHVHYNLEPLFSNNTEKKVQVVFKEKDDKDVSETWRKHWRKAQKAGVNKSIVIGTNVVTSHVAIMVAEKEKNVFSSIGIHPTEYQEIVVEADRDKVIFFDSLFEKVVSDIEELKLIVRQKKVIAIGETGLDYYRLPHDDHEKDTIRNLQKFAFEKQILFAQQHRLPLIIHVRDREIPETPTADNAYWDALDMIAKHNVGDFTLHCVSGPLSYVKAAIEMGGYMGFDGNITYPNAQHIRNIFKIVPEDKRLLETDAPFLPPQEFRGQMCEPWMISKTAEYIETELKVDQNSFSTNAERLFNL